MIASILKKLAHNFLDVQPFLFDRCRRNGRILIAGHVVYRRQHAFPVKLIDRESFGAHGRRGRKNSRKIVFLEQSDVLLLLDGLLSSLSSVYHSGVRVPSPRMLVDFRGGGAARKWCVRLLNRRQFRRLQRAHVPRFQVDGVRVRLE